MIAMGIPLHKLKAVRQMYRVNMDPMDDLIDFHNPKFEPRPMGHVIAARITSENPDEGFKPRPGTVERLFVPGGRNTRWDSHIYAGYKIPATYDSMVGKLIVWGEDREQAIERMRLALDELVIEGIPTTVKLHRRILEHGHFQRGKFSTNFIEDHFG